MQLQTALRELEMITDHLSKKDVDVEAGLKKFKEGVDLIKFCRSQLQKAENEFKKLKVELETVGTQTKHCSWEDIETHTESPFFCSKGTQTEQCPLKSSEMQT